MHQLHFGDILQLHIQILKRQCLLMLSLGLTLEILVANWTCLHRYVMFISQSLGLCSPFFLFSFWSLCEEFIYVVFVC